MQSLGLRLPERPLDTPGHREICRRWLGDPHPATSLHAVKAAARDGPTVATAVLALADLAPARAVAKSPRPAKTAKPRPALAAHARSGHRHPHPPHRVAAPDTARTATGEAPSGEIRRP